RLLEEDTVKDISRVRPTIGLVLHRDQGMCFVDRARGTIQCVDPDVAVVEVGPSRRLDDQAKGLLEPNCDIASIRATRRLWHSEATVYVRVPTRRTDEGHQTCSFRQECAHRLSLKCPTEGRIRHVSGSNGKLGQRAVLQR